MRGAAGEFEESLIERSAGGLSQDRRRRIQLKQAPLINDRDAICECLDFRKSVRRKEKRHGPALHHLGLQVSAKFHRGKSIETARGFIEKKNARPMQQGARKAQALHGARRKRANLAVKRAFDTQLRGKAVNPGEAIAPGEKIELPEKEKVLAARQPGEETEVATGMVPNFAPSRTGIANRIVPRNTRGASRRQQERGENAQKGGFARAICAEQSYRFALLDVERDPR